MKLKGISALEQHVDKIVLGVVCTAFLGALAWQLFFQRLTVKVGGKEVSPGAEAYQPAKSEAEALLSKIDTPAPVLPDIPSPSFGEGLLLGKRLSVPAERGTVAFGATPNIRAGSAVVASAGNFGAIKISAAKNLVVGVTHGTISPVERIRNPELAELLPKEQPFDMAGVAVEAEFDGVALASALRADPDGDGPASAIPLSWWSVSGANVQPMVAILGVELERELVRNPDGTVPAKSDVTKVPAMPGRSDSIASWRAEVKNAAGVPAMLDQTRQAGDVVYRPPYYETIAGPEWVPPSEMEHPAKQASGGTDPKSILRTRLASLDRRVLNLQRQLEGAEQQGPGDRGPRGAGGAGGRGGPNRSNAGGEGDQPGARDPKEAKRVDIDKELQSLTAKRKRVVDDLAKLGEKVAVVVVPSGTARAETPLLENPRVRVWGFDMTGVPGAVYRYRMRTVLNNPMFGRGLPDAQKALSASPVLEAEWSVWSEPVEVEASEYFFVTNAIDRDQTSGRPRAAVEMFKFYYGYYRLASQTIEPGDRIEAVAKLPEMRIADMVKLEKELSENRVPLLDPRVPLKPKSDKKSGEVRENPVEQSLPADPLLSIMPATTPMEIRLSVPSVMLDVRRAGVGANGAARYEAVLRSMSGSLVLESPEGVRQLDAYRKIELSVKAGVDQGKGLDEVNSIDQPSDQDSKQSGPKPPPKPPTGGGGGG